MLGFHKYCKFRKNLILFEITVMSSYVEKRLIRTTIFDISSVFSTVFAVVLIRKKNNNDITRIDQ